MNFWNNFWSADNSKINTPQVILFGIGTLLMLLSIALIVYHCFWHGKGIDEVTVKLIGILLGGGVVNGVGSFFSKTVTSSMTSMGRVPRPDNPLGTKKTPESEGET